MTSLDSTIEQKEKLLVEDLLQTFDWMSKTPEDLGIDDKYIDSMNIAVEGNLFGAPVYGDIYFDPTRQMESILDEVVLYISDNDLSFFDCLNHLKERYGKAYLSGEEPYVAVNGGAVNWYRYYTGKGIVHISKGQNNNFYVLRYCDSEEPKEYQEANRPLTLDELGPLTGYYLKLPEFEDLVIEPVYENTGDEKPLYYELSFNFEKERFTAEIHKNIYDEYQTDLKYEIYEEEGWKYLAWDTFKDRWLIICEPETEDEKLIRVLKTIAGCMGFEFK